MLKNPVFSSDHELHANEIEELREIGRFMRRSHMGEFANYIGDAIVVADLLNLSRLQVAFSDLIQAARDRRDEINRMAHEMAASIRNGKGV